MGNMFVGLFLAFLFMNVVVLSNAQATPKHYNLYIYDVNVTRLCNTTVTLTANGTFPGPTIYAEKGETILVNVYNNGTYGVTIHWHGILQPRNPWSDGPMNVTQCPIQPGSNFTYELIFSTEEGTIWYHAHSHWSMATVHGAIVVYPPNRIYPYPMQPYKEQTIVLSTWYIEEVMKLYYFIMSHRHSEDYYMFPRANATTINGQPGYPNNCSAGSSFVMPVVYGKTYLLRIVNAIINEEQFFGIAGHTLTLVGHDGAYTKPLKTEYIRIAPGQTMDVLFTANQLPWCYYMASQPYFVGTNIPGLTNTTTTAIVAYEGFCHVITAEIVPFPKLPATDNTTAALGFTNAVRSLNSAEHPVVVPKTEDITKSITLVSGAAKVGIVDYSVLNNITFVYPNVSVLEAYNRNLTGYFDKDFPILPEDIPDDLVFGTKAIMFNYSDVVQVIFESADVHPMHIHGFMFYVVASGQGKFEDVEDTITDCIETTDPTVPCYNLVDPPELNTVSIPVRGWVAVRFIANNPGVWFVHCHFERHLWSGMSTVFIVKNGTTVEQSMLPPRDDMPPCTCNTGTECLSSVPNKRASIFRAFSSI